MFDSTTPPSQLRHALRACREQSRILTPASTRCNRDTSPTTADTHHAVVSDSVTLQSARRRSASTMPSYNLHSLSCLKFLISCTWPVRGVDVHAFARCHGAAYLRLLPFERRVRFSTTVVMLEKDDELRYHLCECHCCMASAKVFFIYYRDMLCQCWQR